MTKGMGDTASRSGLSPSVEPASAVSPPAGASIPIAKLRVDDRIRFSGERRAFTVQARNERFLICTKPFAARRTSLYTIIDLERGVRGRCNLIFGMPVGAETREDCEVAMKSLADGSMEVSHRNYVLLEIAALLPAQGIEARQGGDAESGSVHESPVGGADAPIDPSHPQDLP